MGDVKGGGGGDSRTKGQEQSNKGEGCGGGTCCGRFGRREYAKGKNWGEGGGDDGRKWRE